MAGADLPLRAVREQIASAVKIVLHQERRPDGSRHVTQISEITGMAGEAIGLQDLFRWDHPRGSLRPTGAHPACAPALADRGIALPPEMFG